MANTNERQSRHIRLLSCTHCVCIYVYLTFAYISSYFRLFWSAMPFVCMDRLIWQQKFKLRVIKLKRSFSSFFFPFLVMLQVGTRAHLVAFLFRFKLFGWSQNYPQRQDKLISKKENLDDILECCANNDRFKLFI